MVCFLKNRRRNTATINGSIKPIISIFSLFKKFPTVQIYKYCAKLTNIQRFIDIYNQEKTKFIMANNVIQINEEQLKNIIRESVEQTLIDEGFF